MNPIGLLEMIEQIKKELLKPKVDSEQLFAIGNVELELTFTANRVGKGEINLQVVSIGGDASSEHVQRIKITLEPLVAVDELRKQYRQQHPETRTKINTALTRTENEE